MGWLGTIASGAKLVFFYLSGHKPRVIAALIERDGKVLIAKRRKGSRLGGKWEFPGGKLEPGETPEECLRRELREEFDVEAEVAGHFLTVPFSYRCVPLDLVVYRVKCLSGRFELREHDEIAWVFPGDLGKYDFVEADRAVVEKVAAQVPASEGGPGAR